MAMHSRAALQRMGFAALGRDVQVSEQASRHGLGRIALGDRTRIDGDAGKFIADPAVRVVFTGVETGPVLPGRHATVGAGGMIDAGRQAKRLGDRGRQRLEVEARFLASQPR